MNKLHFTQGENHKANCVWCIVFSVEAFVYHHICLVTTYTVLGTDQGNPCTAEKQVTITVNPCLGFIESAGQQGVIIYPNPSNGLFNIRSEIKVVLRVCDALGRELINQEVVPGSAEIDLSGHAGGLYFVEVVSATSKRVIRLQKLAN